LYLEVNPQGRKWWRFKYTSPVSNKEKRISLGVYPETGIQKARELREESRKLIKEGIDPSDKRKEEKHRQSIAANNSFETVARSWWDHWKGEKTSTHANQVLRRLEADIFPSLGTKPVNTLSANDFMRVIKDIQARGVIESAHRALQTCGQIMRFAVAHSLAERNPTTDVKPAD
jgi:Arm DNA-binding domain